MLQVLLFFIQGIPETAGIVACALALAGVRLRWWIILIFACVMSVVIYIIRNLPLTFGLHTVVFILLCALFIARTTRVSTSISFLVSFAGSVMLALLEVAMYELIGVLFHTEIWQLMSDDLVLSLIGLPQAVIMIVLALLIAVFRKPVKGMWVI